MVECFDAKHAREIANAYRVSKYEKELESIYNKISLAAKNGDYEITLDYYDKLVPDRLLDELRKKGFTIKEVPIIFVNRVLGTSKMNSSIFGEAVFGVIKLKVESLYKKKFKHII